MEGKILVAKELKVILSINGVFRIKLTKEYAYIGTGSNVGGDPHIISEVTLRQSVGSPLAIYVGALLNLYSRFKTTALWIKVLQGSP